MKHVARLVPLVVLLIGACAAPRYDEQTDQMISSLQAEVDMKIVALISLDQELASLSSRHDPASARMSLELRKQAGYDANRDFYDRTDSALESLKIRVDAEPNASTKHIDTAIQQLDDNLVGGDGSMRMLHQRQDHLSAVYLDAERDILNQQLQALLTYELVLKQGVR